MDHTIARLFDVLLSLMLLASIPYRVPRSLWLASVGIENGPRIVDGVKVVA
ncbi:hypothetical protein [Streptomyces sp. 6N223]|uniref:hypothetical protein n=1 Tax=Streptomyces sp. 6N223 TaxID=3457412 RepID=UPI003FD2FDF1